MKKRLALLVTLFFCSAIYAVDELPRIAVYVTGEVGANEKNALGTRMLAALVNSGRYRGIERSGAFLAEIEREHETQRSGAIDDDQISALGRQFGVRYVCIADITPAFDAFQVSARIINVETAEVTFIGEAHGSLETMNDLANISDEVIRNMFGEAGRARQTARSPRERQQPPEGTTSFDNFVARTAKFFVDDVFGIESETEPTPKRFQTKYGLRVAYNLSNAGVKVYYTGGNDSEAGSGFEIGVATNTHISRLWSFRSGANVIYRQPVNEGEFNLQEVGIGVPALIRAGGNSLEFAMFLETGFQFDYAVSDIYNRNAFDVGYVLGVGFSVGRYIEIDNRFVWSMRDFVDISEQSGNKLFQYSIGLTYMIGGK